MSLQLVLQERISSAQALLQRAELLVQGVSGHQKLCGKLRAELRFLRRVEAGELQVRESHLHSTNLTHLTAIVESATSLEDVVALLHVFTYRDTAGQRQTLVVDVVANGGHTWVKAVGRKAEALHNIWQGRGQYGDKSIISQAADFLQASRQQEVHYRPPHVVFAFYNGVSCPMAQRLKGMDIAVRGDIVAVNSVTLEEEEQEEEEEEEDEEDDEEDDEEEEEPEEEPAKDEAEGLVENNEEGEWPAEDNKEGEKPAEKEGEGPAEDNGEGPAEDNGEGPAEDNGEGPAEDNGEGPAEDNGEGPAEDNGEEEELTRVDRGTVLARLAFPLQVKVEACRRVNLDITTLITYVSALSHGRCHLSFREPVLTEQAAQERRLPVLPPLDDFLRGKQLFVCRAAVRDFQLILDTLGGPGEKERARALLARLQQVDDRPSPRSLTLTPSAKVNRRSLLIFGTGDSLRAVTMTANSRFVRAAANQGVRYSVFIHQPRALTEGKEWRATPV